MAYKAEAVAGRGGISEKRSSHAWNVVRRGAHRADAPAPPAGQFDQATTATQLRFDGATMEMRNLLCLCIAAPVSFESANEGGKPLEW